MRSCFLHIGTNKTGTTSLQVAFHGFEDAHLVCPDLGRPNQSVPLVNAFHSHPEDYRVNRRGGVSPSAVRAERGAVRAQLAKAIAGTGKDILLTGEGLSNALPAADVAGMRDWLHPHFDRIRVIAYLREPRSLLPSLLQQRLRSDGQVLRDPGLSVGYRRRLGGWLAALPREAVDLVQFHPDHLQDGDLLTDFSRRLGVAPPPGPAVHRKTALSAKAFAVLYLYRHARGRVRGTAEVAANEAVVDWLKRFGTTPLGLGPDFTEALLAGPEAEDIAWAEAALGAPFTPRALPHGARRFTSEADILDQGAALAGALRDWLRRRFPNASWPEADTLTLMDQLFAEAARASRG